MKYNTLDAPQVIKCETFDFSFKKLEPHGRSFAEGPMSQKLRQ